MVGKLKKNDRNHARIVSEEPLASHAAIDKVEGIDVMVDEAKIDQAVETQNIESIVDDSVVPKCGGVLRAKRLELALTTQLIAKQLCLSSKQIEALENNDFDVLPDAMIVKGFIRNYAKLLKISAEPILADYAELKPNTSKHAFAINPGINMRMTENRKASSSRYFIFALLLLLGLGAWFFYKSYIQKPDALNPTPEVAENVPEELSVPMPAVDSDATLDVDADTTVSADEGDASVLGDVVIDDVIQQDDAAATTSEIAVDDEQEANAVESKAPVVKTRLEFNASQETWLSVVNVSGKEVYNKILYAGNRDIVDLIQPSEVVVGNAHGVKLTVNGKSIDLAPYTRINVARIKLNQ